MAAVLTAEAARSVTGPDRPGALGLARASGGRPATGLPGRRLRQVAGVLAITSAVLAVTGLFPHYQEFSTFRMALVTDTSSRWFLVMQAAADLIAGVCLFIPRTRRLAGPGFLLGSTAILAWWLAFLITDKLADGRNLVAGAGFWLEVAAGVTEALAACLAVAAVARTSGIRLLRRPPRARPAWAVILIGAAGALALGFHARAVAPLGDYGFSDIWVPAAIWAAVTALVVPACATLAVPRRLGIALLGGGIAADAATFIFLLSFLITILSISTDIRS